MYGASAPFWAVAVRKAGRQLHTRMVPQLALFAAFSFVVMMFNLPLPGGTTGHAVGVGVAAAVLGPWGAIIAISTAVAIQALFFGDGGVLTLGANCFNMAIVGPLAAWGIYRLLAGRSALTSRRRVMAAAIGGYAAINLAALCAAIEFGLQPALFRDAQGTPLYAPYPLSVAIPAMLVPHLAVAGVAEALFTAGLVAWVQKLDAELLRRASGMVEAAEAPAGRSPRLRAVWVALGLAIMLSPLGLLAGGKAWGEWSSADFASAEGRHEIAAGSGGHLPPGQVPAGLARHEETWMAPAPGYEPRFAPNESAGYVLSGALGCALIMGVFLLAGAANRRRDVAG